jgi:cytochrome c-type biogenesis protein CcmH/NrfF
MRQLRARAAVEVHVQPGRGDAIVASLVEKYGGQQFLVAPIDKGFNRLAWLFPYLLGAVGVVGVGFVTMRWSRHSHARPAEAAPVDPELNERLDDELRNLD